MSQDLAHALHWLLILAVSYGIRLLLLGEM